MQHNNSSSAQAVTTTKLNPGLVAALVALTCMVFSSTPGLVAALGDLHLSLPAVHSASSTAAKKAPAAHAFRASGDGTFVWNNRAAGLSGVVTRTGLEVKSSPTAPAVSLRSLSLGRAGATTSLAAATPAATDETASLRHGNVIEWFQNRSGSLEQGWTIAKRPAGSGDLRLNLGIHGARVHTSGSHALALLPEVGAPLVYGNLVVRDTRGHELPSHFSLTPAGARIVVDDTRAVYPIVIDPDLTAVDTLNTPNSAAGNGLGADLAVNGRWMAAKEAGAHLDPSSSTRLGRVTVYFDQTGAGDWHAVAALDAAPANVTSLGVAVVVEPAGVTVLSVIQPGGVRVWTFAGDPVTQAPNATAVLQQTIPLQAVAGVSLVAISALAADGDLVVAGSSSASPQGVFAPDGPDAGTAPDGVNEQIGVAQVFQRTGGFGTSYAFQTTLHPPGGVTQPAASRDAGQQFGASVALDAAHGLIAVGAPGDDGVQTAAGGTLAAPAPPGTSTNNGAIDVFKFAGGSTWSLTQRLAPTGIPDTARLGSSVAFAGNSGSVLAGAPQEPVGGVLAVGAAYLWDWDGASAWTQVQRITPDDPSTPAVDSPGGATTGTDVASDTTGTHLYVSAPNIQHGNLVNGTATNGSVFVVSRATASGAGTTTAILSAPSPSVTHGGLAQAFGNAIAANATQVAVGAPFQGVDTETIEGRVSVFARSGSTYSLVKDIPPQTTFYPDRYGYAIAQDGDVLAIGMPGSQRGSNFGKGAVAVYTRNASGQWVFDEMLFPYSGVTTASDADSWGSVLAVHEYKNAQGGDAGVVVAIGDPLDDNVDADGNGTGTPTLVSDAGTVSIFGRSSGPGTAWTAFAGFKLWSGGRTGTSTTPGDLTGVEAGGRFGSSVAFTADGTLVVGEPGANGGDGAVERFDRDAAPGSWTFRQDIAGPPGSGQHLGDAVAADGTDVLVAPMDGSGLHRYTDGATNGPLVANGTFPMNLVGFNTGNNLSLVGNRFAVGGGSPTNGDDTVRVYRIVGNVAVREAEFAFASPSLFGHSVSLNHGGTVPTLVVGAPATLGGATGGASVYVAKVKSSGVAQWSSYGQLTNPGNATSSATGQAVTNWPSNGGALVGAPSQTVHVASEGVVYAYDTSTVTPPAGPQPFVDVSLPSTASVGANAVRTNTLLPSLLTKNATTDGAIAATPIGSIDLSQAPRGSAVSQSPISSIPISSIPISSIPISSIPISSIPISSIGGWPALLAGTPFEGLPLQSVMLKDIWELPSVQALPLGALTLAGSPLASIPISSIALGNTPISSIPLDPGSSSSAVTQWCAALTAAGADPEDFGIDCAHPSAPGNDDVTMLSLGVKGAPISSIPISSIPISSIPISSIPISSIPISSIGMSGTPISSIPISSIDIAGTPISSIPISSIPISSIPISSIPISSITLGGTPISSIPISSIDIAGTPISSIPISSIPISSIPISSIPISSIPISSIPISSIPISSILLGGSPISSIPISSIDIAGTPISSIPISSIPISSIPISSIPISSIPISSIPISSIPISSINVAGSPISSIPISSIPISSIPISSIPISSIPAAARARVVDCSSYDCDGKTVGDASAAGALKPDGTLADLEGLLSGARLSDLIGAGDHLTRAQLQAALGSRTLADLSGWDNLKLGELSAIWPYLTLGQIKDQLGGVRLSDVADHLLEFTANQVRQALDNAHLTAADVSDWDDVTLGELGAIGQYVHLSDLTSSLGKLRLGDLAGAIHKPGGGTYSADDLKSALAQALPGATFGSLHNFGDLTLGELGTYGDTTLAQLLGALTGDTADHITLGDVLLTLLNPKQFPWDALDLGQVSTQALDDSPSGTPVQVAYRADAPDGLPRTVRVTVQLPHGSRLETGATGDGSAAERTPVVDGDTATWTFENVSANAVRQLAFVMDAPLAIGPARVSATAFMPADDATMTDNADTLVKESGEPNDTIAQAVPLEDDTIALSHVSHAGDIDVYKFTVSDPGTRVSISLSNLDADLDAVLYAPRDGSIVATSGKTIDPVADSGGAHAPGSHQPGSVSTQSTPGNDIQKPTDLGNLAVTQASFNRGRANEQIDTGLLTRTGTYYLAVSGYNAAVNTQPYALRLKRFVSNTQPACPSRTVSPGAIGTQLPQTLPDGTNTVFVVNQSRTAGLYGDEAASTLMSKVSSFVSWLNASGQDEKAAVLTVDADPAVRAAYAQWDASPCLPSGANGVVSEVARVLNGYRGSGSTLKSVVMVGGDDALPFARVPDRTAVANESGYSTTFSSAGNALFATFATSSVQTDNAYVDRSPYAFGDRTLYVPDTTIGRLVESPTEIADQLDDFQAADGKLAVGTGLVTGYDFLSDGATAVKKEVTKTYGSVDSGLISDTWTRADLESAIEAIKPDLLSINAHFDHSRALPGAGNASHDESDLFQAAAVRGALNGDLAGSVVFSMGCHSGLSVSDELVSSNSLDFAQAVSSQGGVFVGNTGFGYGDTDTVALSEQLMADFAQRLDGSMSVGEALLYAKNAYFSGLAEYTPYDEKVLQETTFYGLPFYRLDVPNPPSQPAPVSPVLSPDALTGLQSTTTHLTPTYVNRTADDGTTYTAAVDPATGEDSLTTVQNRPVEPKVDQEYALPAGLSAHDGLVLGMTSVDHSSTDPYVFQPIVDDSGERTDVGVNTAFPTRAVRVNSGLAPAGETFHVATTTGYFRTTSKDGKGLQRTYKSVDVLTYLPSDGNDDYVAPTFSQVTGSVHDGALSVSAHVLDDRGDASRVKRVRLLLLQDPRDGVATVWRGLDLVRTAGSEEWTGSLPTTGRNLEFILQAVDAAGNVGVTTDKAENFSDDDAVVGAVNDPTDGGGGTPFGDLTLSLGGQQGSNNWYTGPVTVTATGGARLVYEIVGENDPTGYQEPFTVTGTGLHTVRVTSADGQTQQVTIAVDTVGPVAQISSPAPGQNLPAVPGALISYSCPDAGSGGTTCTATVDSSPIPVPSGTTLMLAPGAHTVTVYAGPDLAGNPASVPTLTRAFTVLGAPATVGTIGVSKAQDGAVTTLSIPFTGYSALTYSGTVAWGDGGSTNCAMAGSGCTITRNASGGGTLTVTHTYNTAWVDTTATVTVVDNLGQTASATVKVNKKTTLTATAALLQLKVGTNIVELKSGAISATLKDGAGAPLAGQTIKFTFAGGSSICTATTNASGVASCPNNLLYSVAMILSGRYTATFPGKDAYHGSSASASLIG